MVLKEAFPVLLGISCANDASVADNLEILGGSIQWNVSFVREAHDWEENVFASFFQVLYSAIVSRDRGIVQIGSGGSLSRRACSRSNPSLTPWLALKVGASLKKSEWQPQAPPRTVFFCVVGGLR